MSSGVRQGFVDEYFLLDMSAGFDFADYVPGRRLDVTAQNLLDHVHRQYVGVPKIGRLVLARLTYSWYPLFREESPIESPGGVITACPSPSYYDRTSDKDRRCPSSSGLRFHRIAHSR